MFCLNRIEYTIFYKMQKTLFFVSINLQSCLINGMKLSRFEFRSMILHSVCRVDCSISQSD